MTRIEFVSIASAREFYAFRRARPYIPVERVHSFWIGRKLARKVVAA
jgi:hypothetical protein